jgi:hypothetical protein
MPEPAVAVASDTDTNLGLGHFLAINEHVTVAEKALRHAVRRCETALCITGPPPNSCVVVQRHGQMILNQVRNIVFSTNP